MPSRQFAYNLLAVRQTYYRLLAVVWLGALAGWFTGSAHAQQPSASPYRLRVYCDTGGEPVVWRGHARLSQGKLSAVQPWGEESDAASVAIEKAGQITIAPRLPRKIAAFDVTADADPQAVLHLELTPGAGAPVFVEMPLAELLQNAHKVTIGKSGTLQIFRAADDHLRIQTERDSLLFEPGEKFSFQLHADPPGVAPGTPVDLQVDLLPGRGGEALPGGQRQRVVLGPEGLASADFEIPLPSAEGTYTVQISARKPAGLVRGWTRGAGKAIAQRSFQVLVWDASQATRLSQEPSLVLDIDPTNSHWWRLMPEWKWMRKVPWLPQGPIGSSATQVVPRPQGKLVQLTPAVDGQLAWQAYPLPVTQPGAAHVLEVEVPDDERQQLSLTLFDRDALGRAASLGDALAAVTGDQGLQARGGKTIVRRLFWPKTDSPMLVVSNRSEQSPAFYGRIRVFSLARTAAQPVSPDSNQPLVAVSLSELRLPAALQASHRVSSDGRYVVEDLQTYYQTARRLADYVQQAGYNGAVVQVASAGGALYPSQLLGTQTGPQRGQLASGMEDVPRKDLLDLLLREFDRRGLRLVPRLALQGALAQVEQQRKSADDLQVDALRPTGEPFDANLVRYNPLNPAVRTALNEVLQEVAKRYAKHPAFAGIALDLSASSHLTFASDQAASDAEMVDRFLAATHQTWPAATPRDAEQVRQALAGPWRDAWREWRGQQLAELFALAASDLQSHRPDAQLLLLANQLFDDAKGQAALRPRLGGRPSLPALLATRGVVASKLAKTPGVTFVVPAAATPSEDSNADAAYLQYCELSVEKPQGTGAAIRSLAAQASLLGFKARSPFGAQQTFTAALSAERAFGVQSPRTLTLAATSIGGPVLVESSNGLPLELADAAVACRKSYQQLPLTIARKVDSAQPIAMQQLADADGTTLVVGNRTAWPSTANVSFVASQPCTVTIQQDAAKQLAAGKQRVPVEVEPYGLKLVKFDSPEVVVQQAEVKPVVDAQPLLAVQVNTLSRRNLSARRRLMQEENLSFEQIDAQDQPIGWQWVDDPQLGRVSINRRSPIDGQAAVEVIAGANPMHLASKPFAPPATRQLAIAFCVRTERAMPNSSLTIHFQADGGYNTYTTVDAQALAAADQWRQFVFADNLPLNMPGNMRVVFVARNVDVSIDRIEIDSLTFPLDFALPAVSARQRLALVKLQQSASMALEDGRVADCQQIVESHWARFLTSYTPLLEPQAEVVQAAEEATTEDPQQEPTPEVSSRWKSYIPGFLRF